MTATNHGLFGAFIAVTLQTNPVIAICVAPFSHFLLDALPHFGEDNLDLHGRRFFRILLTDATLAVVSTICVAYVYSQIWWLVILCAFLAASPDLMWIYYVYVDDSKAKKHIIPKFHGWIQWSQTPRGLYVETAWFFVFFIGLIWSGLQ